MRKLALFKQTYLIATLLFGFCSNLSFATNAPNGPGRLGSWARPDKSFYSSSLTRPVYATGVGSSLSEVMFPTPDRAQVRDLFFILRIGDTVYDERRSAQFVVQRFPESLSFQIKTVTPLGVITKRIQVLAGSNAVQMEVSVAWANISKGSKEIILVHNPAAENTPGGDGIQVLKDSRNEPLLLAYQADVRGDEPAFLRQGLVQMVGWSLKNSTATVGFEGVNSPLDLMALGQWGRVSYDRALYGNVSGAMVAPSNSQVENFNVVLAFDSGADAARLTQTVLALLKNTFAGEFLVNQKLWRQYLSRLTFDSADVLSESSILVLKALEDKLHPGALIAAPALPGIPWTAEAQESNYEEARRRIGDTNSGYRRVWPRDLYHKALALLSVNDLQTPVAIANFYLRTQLSGSQDGQWAQNMWTDGTPSWGAFQLDQSGFPILLILRLVEKNIISYPTYRGMVQRAANAILRKGPATDQERWEENSGISPNSLSVAVQALFAAAVLESKVGDTTRAKVYFDKASEWLNNLKLWTLVPNGVYGSNYFARIERGANGVFDPSQHSFYEIHNKREGMKKFFSEDEILDGGFWEWIMAGLVAPQDLDFTRTLQIVDRKLRKSVGQETGYIRYNEDSFGENFVGGIWPLLSGERAIVAIMRKEDPMPFFSSLRSSASSAHLLPEQTTLSVRPLGWSHANYLITLRSIREKRSYYVQNDVTRLANQARVAVRRSFVAPLLQ